MKYAQPADRRMVVLELEGAPVHDHTSSELIRAGFPFEPERCEKALDLHEKESAGDAKPEEALVQYSNLARGLSLRRAIEYATFKMRFVNGFDTFIRQPPSKGKLDFRAGYASEHPLSSRNLCVLQAKRSGHPFVNCLVPRQGSGF